MLTHGSFNTTPAGCAKRSRPSVAWLVKDHLCNGLRTIVCTMRRSDQEGDPHSPNDGGWWSHVFWLAYNVGGKDQKEFYIESGRLIFTRTLHAHAQLCFPADQCDFVANLGRHWLLDRRNTIGCFLVGFGPFASAWFLCSIALGWSTPPVTCGAIATTKLATTAATIGGWR